MKASVASASRLVRPFLPLLALGASPALAQSSAEASRGAWPMGYLDASGSQASAIHPLLWGLIWLSVAVVAIITALVIVGIVVRGRVGRTIADAPVSRTGLGTLWIYIGVGVSTIVLVVFTGWTVITMAAIGAPSTPATMTIEVLAHQWWWQFTYDAQGEQSTRFVTANEIHIPVGVPVRFVVQTADVIHSFWVPALGGKLDAIPGRANETWLEADEPGIYRGQCTEYCGEQHAQMALRVVAESPEDFTRWRDHQLESPAPPTDPLIAAGAQRFMLRCASCHAVRGTAAGGIVGPDLSHLMQRTTLAAGMLANTPANLGGWIANPQTIKPGAKMPNLDLSGPELHAVEAYLETLS